VSRSFADDVRAGLTALPKAIPPRWFYDELGSALFEAITHLPEYYVTRAEAELLSGRRQEMAEAIGPVARIVELGSGTARKSRLLLEGRTVEYVPIDIDLPMLERVRRELAIEQPSVKVTPVVADFRQAGPHLGNAGRTCVLFLGSTIGNLNHTEAVALLGDARKALKPGDLFLLGADLKKPKAILDEAYNDALGVTASFNLNLLQRINRELGGHFDLNSFRHRAFYEEERGRIEMHLVSLRDQTVSIDAIGLTASFDEGETIHTENSYKYDQPTLDRLARDGGFEIVKRWTDSRGWFTDVLMEAR
jgi:dimethylhistidine N-methyltransferase